VSTTSGKAATVPSSIWSTATLEALNLQYLVASPARVRELKANRDGLMT